MLFSMIGDKISCTWSQVLSSPLYVCGSDLLYSIGRLNALYTYIKELPSN